MTPLRKHTSLYSGVKVTTVKSAYELSAHRAGTWPISVAWNEWGISLQSFCSDDSYAQCVVDKTDGKCNLLKNSLPNIGKPCTIFQGNLKWSLQKAFHSEWLPLGMVPRLVASGICAITKSVPMMRHYIWTNTNLISDSLISLRAAILLLTSSRSLIPRASRLLRLSMNRKIPSMSALACKTQQMKSRIHNHYHLQIHVSHIWKQFH